MSSLCRLTGRLGISLFLSHPERDPQTEKLYNSLFVIDADSRCVRAHRKINTLCVGSEAWSNPGDRAEPIVLPPVGRVGLLICVDAYSPAIARDLKAQGARILVSSAAWAPGFHGPNGEWERCTKDTGLPLLVCNRTGPDRTLQFNHAESVVAQDAQRLLSLRSERAAVFLCRGTPSPPLSTSASSCRQPGHPNLLFGLSDAHRFPSPLASPHQAGHRSLTLPACGSAYGVLRLSRSA